MMSTDSVNPTTGNNACLPGCTVAEQRPHLSKQLLLDFGNEWRHQLCTQLWVVCLQGPLQRCCHLA
mgnify:CR=1 FL=1